jgi:hypothetical protein
MGMKLRVQNGSLRLRLGPREVEAILRSGVVEETVQLAPGQKLTYVLRVDAVATELGARLDGARVVVSVPAEMARAWAGGEQVGMESRQDAGGGMLLRILVEKDFQCLEPGSRQGDADVFPNPKLDC